MARSTDLRATRRCERCRLPPRWCVCAAHQIISCPVQVDVLMHQREWWRPSSTGHLITRAMAGCRAHLWLYDKPVVRDEVRAPEREMWVLHPHGGPMPAPPALEKLQVVLLDGAWREATMMAREVTSWGRPVSLPMSGQSRYWLRTQQNGARFSTAEALIFFLEAVGLTEASAALRVQFEWHVYAGLRSRGAKAVAQDFLQASPLPHAMPELLARFDRPAVG